mmetsp:Transcript_11195/g.15427  ORF Transcript_11195/g.15427 Transcript_11195/m.15427 type:complete len:89 (-) Transcript_11195:119-385(-)
MQKINFITLSFLPLDSMHSFLRIAYTDDYRKVFSSELVFDIAGVVHLSGGFYSFECVEVKLSGRQEALDQLMVRMGIIWTALSILLST